MTKALSELQRRHSALLVGDRAIWREWERALGHWAAGKQELERRRAIWEQRVAIAMRGVKPETWWRYHRRMEAGELWVGPGAKAVRAQQLVQVSRAAVLGLVARRYDDLRAVTLAERRAAAEVRAATVKVVAAQGVRRVATVLSVPPAIVRALCSEDQSTAVLDALAPSLLCPHPAARHAVSD